ncbi:hypothetical protein LCGC14_2742050 [marine sediment metagenome]|uniref:Uncharacterized protein n=1 Tax=marine sediment metagenome TaxID=412755 RepID=A0A0F8Z464_9ZZZZ
MKTELHEHKGCFCLNMIPENEKEIALLIRMGMNAKQTTCRVATDVYSDLTVSSYITVRKYHKESSTILKHK